MVVCNGTPFMIENISAFVDNVVRLPPEGVELHYLR